MVNKRIETILFDYPQFRGSRPSTISRRALLQYIYERKEKQRLDNEAVHSCGVDYVFAREIFAHVLHASIIPIKKGGVGSQGAKHTLNTYGRTVWLELLSLGVSRATLVEWLKKYQDCYLSIWVPRG